MKRIILLIISITLIYISTVILFIKINNNYLVINYVKTDIESVEIFIEGEVKICGYISTSKNELVYNAIKPYFTKNSDLNSIDKSAIVKNNQVYNISYKEKLNINEASLNELCKLEEIGNVRASAIINGRPYEKIEELVEKKIISQAIFSTIENEISI